jgi:hypothetical protein
VGQALKSILIGVFVCGLLVAGVVGGWVAMNYYNPGAAPTPAHAGVVSHGEPDECTNESFIVRPRRSAERRVIFNESGLARGTFEAHGGIGHVDILLRIVDPQGLEIYASPRVETTDFTFPVPIRGEYTFVFDNTYSLYTSKSVGLFHCLEPQPVPVQPFAPQ